MLFWLTLIRILDWASPRYAVRVAAHLFATPKRIPRPPHENKLIEGGQRIVLKCGLIAYKFGEGQPVLLVHGWEGRGTQLGSFAEALVKKGYAVYALDGPAHGESPGRQTTPVHYATFIKSVGRELGPLKALISHSFGAGSSVIAATEGLNVEKIILIAGPDRYSRVVENFCHQLKMGSVTRQLFFDEVTSRIGIPPEDLQVSQWARRMAARLMVVHDKGDKAVLFEASVRIHAAVPGSEFLITEGLGHRRILKDPEVIQRVAEFIN